MREEGLHKPALLKEAIEALNVRKRKRYIDATVGMGGHTGEILKRGGRVLGIDCDPEAIEILRTKSKEQKAKNKKLILARGNFRDIKKIAEEHDFGKVAGILFDLGLSSWQIEKSGRGFSYLKDEPLDMRMDSSCKLTAAEIINNLTKEELYEIFTKFGEEVNSWAVANALISARPIETTNELVKVITRVISGREEVQALPKKAIPHLARFFQALRIVVNDELESLKTALPQAVELLEKGGRLAVISFHSLEDRIVKFELRAKNLRIITKKPIMSSKEVIMVNFRSRSARLRVVERI